MSIDQSSELFRSQSTKSEKDRPTEEPLVIIVDDDSAVREAVTELMLSAGLQARCFASTRDLLSSDALNRLGCLILDVRMPGSSGLDLQARLARHGIRKPIIFITGHGDVPMTVQAMKAGAVDFLTKPVRDQALLDAVLVAIEKDAVLRAEAAVTKRTIDLIEALTPRERQVLGHLSRGSLNKQIAFELGISEVTVKLHRSNLMRKMNATSVNQLMKVWETLPVSVREFCNIHSARMTYA